jgi:hypothetical protein
MEHAREALDEAPLGAFAAGSKDFQHVLSRAKEALESYTKSPVRTALLGGDLARIEEGLLAVLEWFDDKNDVKVNAVAGVVGALISSWPQRPANEEDFIAQMIEEVHDWEPHPFILGDACRKLRLTLKFTPSIAELYAAYQAGQRQWCDRWDSLENAEYYCSELTKLIEQKTEEERQYRERKERERLEREAREKQRQEEQERERQAIVTFLNGIDDAMRDDFDLGAHYQHHWKLVCALFRVVAHGVDDFTLGCRHHEGCNIHESDVCDCEPSLWGINAHGFWFVDGVFMNMNGATPWPRTVRCTTLAEAQRLSTPRRP